MTTGNNHNIDCPHCGKTNHGVCHNLNTDLNKVTEFQKPCALCGKMVYYWAQWELTVTAEKPKEVV